MSGIIIDVNAKTAQAEKDLQSINKSIKNIETSTKGVSDSLKQMFVSIGGLAALGGSLAYVKNISTEFKQLENKIATVTGRTKELVAVQSGLLDIAKATRGSVANTVQTYTTFGRALKNTHQSSRDILTVTKAIQQSFAISGTAAESANSAIIQLGQGLSSGTLRGDEFNSVMEQAPGLIEAITKELKVTQGELRAMAAEGKVTGDIVFKSLLAQASNINKEFSVLAPTLAEASQATAQAFKVLVNELDKGVGLTDAMGLRSFNIAKRIEEASKGAFEFGINIALAYYGLKAKILGIVAEIRQSFNTIKNSITQAFPPDLIDNLLAKDFETALYQIKDLFSTVLQSISGEVSRIAKDIFYKMSGKTEFVMILLSIRNFTTATVDMFKDLFRIVTGSVGWTGLIDDITGTSSSLWALTSSGLLRFKNNFISLFSDIFDKVINIYKKIIIFSKELMNGVFKSDFSSKFSFTVDIDKAVANIKQAYETIKDKIFKTIEPPASLKYGTFIALHVAIPSLMDSLLNSVRDNSALNSVISTLDTFSKKVIDIFYNIYDQVIGHSWWTDTIGEVVSSSNTLWAKVSSGLLLFETNVISVFKGIYDYVSPYAKAISGLFENIASKGPTSFKVNIDFDKIQTDFLAFIEKVKGNMSELGDKFPSILKTAAYGLGFLLVKNLFPVPAIEGALLAAFATSGVFLLDNLSQVLTDKGLLSALGKTLGEGAVLFATTFIAEIPNILSSLLGLITSFTEGFLTNIPIIGGAIKALFGFASVFGLDGILGLVGTVLFGTGVISLLKGFGVIESAAMLFGTKMTKLATFFMGRGGLVSSALFGGPNTVRIVATLLSVIDAFDGFRSLFDDSLIGHTIAQGGLFYLMLTGKTGLSNIIGNFRTTVLDPITSGIHRTLKDFEKIKPQQEDWIKNMPAAGQTDLFGGVESKPGMRSMKVDSLRMARSKIDDFIGFASTKFQAFDIGVNDFVSKTGSSTKKMFSTIAEASSTALNTGNFKGAITSITSASNVFMTSMTTMGGMQGAIGRLIFGKVGMIVWLSLLAIFFAKSASASEDFQNKLEVKKNPFDQIKGYFGEMNLSLKEGWGQNVVYGTLAIAAITSAILIFKSIVSSIFSVEIPAAVGVGASRTTATFSGMLSKLVTSSKLAGGSIASSLGGIATNLAPLLGGAVNKVASFTGSIVKSFSGVGIIAGGAFLGAIAGRMMGGNELASIGFAMGGMIAFGMASAITSAISTFLVGLGVTLTTATVGLFAIGATVVGAILLWLFGDSGNVFTELDLVIEKLKEISGFGKDTTLSSKTGLSKEAEEFAKTLPLQLKYNLEDINFELLSDRENERTKDAIKELQDSLDSAAKDFEKGLQPTPETVNSIAALAKRANLLGEKASAKTQVDATNLPKSLLQLRNLDPTDTLGRISKYIAQSSISLQYYNQVAGQTVLSWFAMTDASKAYFAERKRGLAEDVAAGKFTVGGQAPSERESELMFQLAGLKNLTIDPSIERDLNKLTDAYYNLFKEVEVSKLGETVLRLKEPLKEVTNAYLDQIEAQLRWARLNDAQTKGIDKFQKRLLAISANFKKLDITFDASKVLIKDDETLNKIELLSNEAKRLGEQVSKTSGVVEQNKILIQIEEVKTLITRYSTEIIGLDNTRKQFKLVELAAKVGITGITEEMALTFSDAEADMYYNKWNKLFLRLEDLKTKAVGNMNTVGTALFISQDQPEANGMGFSPRMGDLQKMWGIQNESFVPALKAFSGEVTQAQEDFNSNVASGTASTLALKTQAEKANVGLYDAIGRVGVDSTKTTIAEINRLKDSITNLEREGKNLQSIPGLEDQIVQLQTSLKKIDPETFQNLSDRLGLGLAPQDTVLLTQNAYDNIMAAGNAVRLLDMRVEEAKGKLSKSELDVIVKKKMALIESAMVSAGEVVYSTGDKINQALSGFGITSADQISLLPDNAIRELLSYQEGISSLKRELAKPVDLQTFKELNKGLADTEKQAKGIVDKFGSLETVVGNINSVFKTSLSLTDLSGFSNSFMASIKKTANRLKLELADAIKSGELTDATRNLLTEMKAIFLQGEFITIFSELGKSLESALVGGAKAGFDKFKSIYAESQVSFRQYAMLAPTARRELTQKASYQESFQKASNLQLSPEQADILNRIGTGEDIQKVMEDFQDQFRGILDEKNPIITSQDALKESVDALKESFDKSISDAVTAPKVGKDIASNINGGIGAEGVPKLLVRPKSNKGVGELSTETLLSGELASKKREFETLGKLLAKANFKGVLDSAEGFSQEVIDIASKSQLEQAAKIKVELSSLQAKLAEARLKGFDTQDLQEKVDSYTNELSKIPYAIDYARNAIKEAGVSMRDAVDSSFRTGLSDLMKGKVEEGLSPFQTFVKGIKENIKTTMIDNFSKAVSDKLTGPGSPIAKLTEDVGAGMYGMINKLISGGEDVLSGGFSSLVGLFTKGFGDTLGKIGTSVKDLFTTGSLKDIGDLFSKGLSAVTGMFGGDSKSGGSGGGFMSSITGMFSGLFGGGDSSGGGFMSSITGMLGGLFGGGGDSGGGGLFSSLFGGSKSGAGGVITSDDPNTQALISAGTADTDRLIAAISGGGGMGGISSMLGGGGADGGLGAGGIPNLLGRRNGGLNSEGIPNLLAAPDQGGDMFSGITDSLTKTFSGLFGDGGTITDLLGSFGEGAGDMFSGLLDGLMGMLGGGGGGDILGTVMGALGGIGGFFADGGLAGQIKGAGTSRSDSIPAMLSNGEFIVNAKSTKENLKLLTNINSGRIKKLAEGGLSNFTPMPIVPSLGSSRTMMTPKPLDTSKINGGKASGNQIINMSFTGDISRQTKAEVFKMLPDIANGVNVHNKEKGYKR
jgi:tape measure domain-containing protein